MQTFLVPNTPPNSSNLQKPKAAKFNNPAHEFLAFVEIQASTPPSSVIISHPISNKEILNLTNLEETEWTGEIIVPLPSHLLTTEGEININPDTSATLELNVKANWKDTADDAQNFLFISIGLPQLTDSSTVLRSPEDIDTTATFSLR